jgi:sugar phosphate isomerase/epimerase
MSTDKVRRDFLKQAAFGTVAAAVGAASIEPSGLSSLQASEKEPRFRISLAGWSLHKAIYGHLVRMLDFPRIARQTFGIEAIELVNTLFEVPTQDYVSELKKNAKSENVKILLIMCDDEGALAHRDKAERMMSVQSHHKWVDIAADLGCHSIRVNMRGEEKGMAGNPKAVDEFVNRSLDAFAALAEYAAKSHINVIIENHGGLSSNADVLVRVMKGVNLPNFGTLPDFGNFDPDQDRYEGIRKLMPYAKGVSGKFYDFDAKGNETVVDFDRMMKIVLDDSKFKGYIDVEYEGERLSEYEGIVASKRLLERYQRG